MSSNERWVRCRISKSRTVDRIAFSAEGLTAGVKLQNSSLFRELLTIRGPELVSQKVKHDIRIPPFALAIPAIDDFGFDRMHFQAALCQAVLKLCLEGFSFSLAAAVHQPVVCIPTPREAGVCPRHPEVKSIVQEKIGKYRANHSPLRGTASSLHKHSLLFHGGRQPSLDV